MHPTLDVVIATNRRSPFLEETLASVVAQSEVECNIVVVDDGSPCPGYVRDCAANFARTVVVRQAPAGLAAARNRGLREGEAAFVAFLDDDDAWHPLKAKKQIDALAREPKRVACFCWGSYVDGSGRELGAWAPATSVPSVAFLRGASPLPRIVTLIVRRQICEEVGGFNETYAIGEDHDFILRVSLRGEMVAVPDKLVYYRQHGENISQYFGTKSRDAGDRMVRDLIVLCEERGDREGAGLLREQLPKVRANACVASLRGMRHGVRQRSRAAVVCEAQWLARHVAWLPAMIRQGLVRRRSK